MLQRKYRIPKKLFPHLKKNTLVEGEFFDLRITRTSKAGDPRFVCIISKKVFARATERNRQKRRVYSALSDILKTYQGGGYTQVFPKKTITALKQEELKKALQKTLNK